VDIKSNTRLPLQGLIVLDLTRLLPGPLCTMLLGDYGANIIKIEDTDAGDPTRFVGRFFEGSGSFFRQLNRNKRSLALNLKTEAGKKIIFQLAGKADVLVEGFRPGVMNRLGIGYESLKLINPKLIYAAISGYGQSGPYRERAGHDINYSALSGLLDLSAEKNGLPVVPSAQIADIAGGSLMAVNGIMFALYELERSGRGQFVDISMTRGLLPWLTYAASTLGSDESLPRRGNGHITGAFACYNIYETADEKQMSLGALEPIFWQRFCVAVGKPEWSSLQFDQESREDLLEKVSTIFKEKSRKEWETLFSDIDACCEPVLDLQEAIEHPLNKDSFNWIDYRCTDGAKEKLTGFPLLFNDQPGKMLLPPPRHGEHSREILEGLGYDQAEIAELINTLVIKTADTQ
jgi:crotonobetainyl-CoA:carnitine CoA-transferase CaiB-like acyl-CoA transferase